LLGLVIDQSAVLQASASGEMGEIRNALGRDGILQLARRGRSC
jgi:hypothetical protein